MRVNVDRDELSLEKQLVLWTLEPTTPTSPTSPPVGSNDTLFSPSFAYAYDTTDGATPVAQTPKSDSGFYDSARADYMRCRSKSEGSKSIQETTCTLKSVLKKSDSDGTLLKRRVCFADMFGLDLESICRFEADSDSDCDASPAFSGSSDSGVGFDKTYATYPGASRTNLLRTRLGDQDEDAYRSPSPVDFQGTTRKQLMSHRRFVPYFTLPWADTTVNGGVTSKVANARVLYAVLDDRKICLETFTVVPWIVRGTVLVKNMSFEKRVYVRSSLDKWCTFQDTEAQYLCSTGPNVDRFRFELKFTFKLEPGSRLELAFAYASSSNGATYWDNNCGANYAFWYCDRVNQ